MTLFPEQELKAQQTW